MFRCLIAKLLLCGCQSFIKESYLLTYLLTEQITKNSNAVDAVLEVTVVGMSVDGFDGDVDVVTFVIKQPVAGPHSHVVATRCFATAAN